MLKNTNYSGKKTLTKGMKQAVNILSSTGFSALVVLLMKFMFDKEFKAEDIKQIIDEMTGSIVLIIPVVSSLIAMINNFRKNYFVSRK